MRAKKSNYSSSKSERFEARLSQTQKEVLQHAADLSGRSLSDFVLMASQEAANKVIREHEVISLTAKESKLFVEALLNPPRMNEAMKRALRKHRDLFGDSSDSEDS